MTTRNVRVLVVDDSAFNRKTLTKMLESAPGIEVIDTAYDGQVALKKIKLMNPDVVTLDLEMPVMDGFTVLRWTMANHPVPTIVVSGKSHDENVFRAMELGAVDFIAKPTARASLELQTIQEDLIRKIFTASSAHLILHEAPFAIPTGEVQEDTKAPVKEPDTGTHAELVLIGSSTGGPTAIQTILSSIPGDLPISVIVAQHMPAVFTSLFAERLNKYSPMTVSEARDGDDIQPHHAYIAPGGMQTSVARSDGKYVLKTKPKGVKDRFAPSIDFLFKSAAEACQGDISILGVILTGMGGEGVPGMEALKKAGATTLVESPETAIIRTMPEEVIQNGLADTVCDTEDVPHEILRHCALAQKDQN